MGEKGHGLIMYDSEFTWPVKKLLPQKQKIINQIYVPGLNRSTCIV